eukprot:CAMPEP_0201544774 /NCGR_PEP_ID=MMETSP0173_2-20130828/1390_1 /ASSEMBLY_ACC=CAM_ASM_000268 /TAXON_ID=218659 /ORGANISM="Vexillifera sp., Strain DIVA3 564/2" /LENGTH=145 /DNA_ID=CAMNT_0047953013 /DNA_START=26 /DNA_END=463 /DNA_ORIENTATION=-
MSSSNNPLAGSWELDAANSESLENLLSAQGVGWMKRKVITKLHITEILEFRDDSVVMKKETSVKNTEETLPLDKEEIIEDEILGKVKQLATTDGKKLTITLTANDGSGACTKNVRSVEGDVLTIYSKFVDKKGKVTECTRKFNRK